MDGVRGVSGWRRVGWGVVDECLVVGDGDDGGRVMVDGWWRMGGGSWVDGGGWVVVVVEWHGVNSGDGAFVVVGWREGRDEGWAGGGVEVRMAGGWEVG